MRRKMPGRKSSRAPQLSLRIEGKYLTGERFVRAVSSFFDLLGEVSEAMAGDRRAVDWIVSVKKGSAIISASPRARKDAADVRAILDAAFDGLREIQRGEERPNYFSDDALHDTRALARLADGKAVTSVEIRRSGRRFTANERIVGNVDVLLGGTLSEVGVIEGRMEMISTRGMGRVGVWDSLRDRFVRCYVTGEMIADAKQHLGRRVAIEGTIKYRATGEPVSIDASRIHVFPERRNLPTASEVFGILAEAK